MASRVQHRTRLQNVRSARLENTNPPRVKTIAPEKCVQWACMALRGHLQCFRAFSAPGESTNPTADSTRATHPSVHRGDTATHPPCDLKTYARIALLGNGRIKLDSCSAREHHAQQTDTARWLLSALYRRHAKIVRTVNTRTLRVKGRAWVIFNARPEDFSRAMAQ